MPRFIALLGVAFTITTFPACAQNAAAPTHSDDASLSAYFDGGWHVAFPDKEGVIVNVPDADCAAPVLLKAVSDDVLSYESPKGGGFTAELMEFEGRITWMPTENGPYTFIAERKNEDQFWLYTAQMGKADWESPKEYTRCE